MRGGKKIIGVCVTKVHSVGLSEYLFYLQNAAISAGYKLIIFNSTEDFFYKGDNEKGAVSVYKLINYDIIDALVVYYESFRDHAVADSFIDDAKAHDTPVVVLKGSVEGCYCIINEYTEGFKQLMEHVIREHKVTDSCFIAGNRENDPDSIIRINCYREVLESNGIEYSEENVYYGGYWYAPALESLKDIMTKRSKRPQAIFCANDYMAIAICDDLHNYGISCPEDIIVTGFDGVPEAEYFMPKLTTCKEDFRTFGFQTISIIKEILENGSSPMIHLNKFTPYFSESCGCPAETQDFRLAAKQQFGIAHDSLSHEEFVFEWLDRSLDVRDINSLTAMIPELLITESYFCLNSDFIAQMVETDFDRGFPFSEEMDVIRSKYSSRSPDVKKFAVSDIVPDLDSWLGDNSAYIIGSVYADGEVYGYYAAKSEELRYDPHRANRLFKSLNVAFNSLVGFYRQRMMLVGLRAAAFTDQLTGLPNLKGTTEWFEDFSSDPENHKRAVSFSVYAVFDYKYIYENYGIKEIEEIVCFVAENLKLANNDMCFIGRVSEGEFMVINYYDSPEDISKVINAATSKFYSALDSYRVHNTKEFNLEVNAGCIEGMPGWQGTLATFSKLAGNEMYLNRLNANTERTVQKTQLPEDIYKRFELLVDKNLFSYHFQPIIDAHTGEIVAYEALMRPDRSINMSPSEVIQAAEEYGRLYDIEKATMFNVLAAYSKSPEIFMGRKIFVNSIPGHFLTGDDYDKFIAQYGSEMRQIVIEITEGSSVSDKELEKVKSFSFGGTPIAIDDFGTGHSNIVNLLRYSPQIIKVDRFLISGIQNDSNKQMFFRSAVEFARMNDILVLAEGVETAEELKCVKRLGADLIQGYYTGRPAPIPLAELDGKIKEELLGA